MATATEIINLALGAIGIKAPGDLVDPNEAADVLVILNAMMDAWRTESLYAYYLQRLTASVATATKTIGPAGDFIIASRPERIEVGSFFSSGLTDYPVRPIDADSYNRIMVKTNGGLGPNVVYFDQNWPQGTLYFYPVPATAVVVTLLVQTQLTEFANLTTVYDIPPGYKRAIYMTLAEEVASAYEREIPPTLARNAAAARRNIKRINLRVPVLRIDPSIPQGYPYTLYR